MTSRRTVIETRLPHAPLPNLRANASAEEAAADTVPREAAAAAAVEAEREEAEEESSAWGPLGMGS